MTFLSNAFGFGGLNGDRGSNLWANSAASWLLHMAPRPNRTLMEAAPTEYTLPTTELRQSTNKGKRPQKKGSEDVTVGEIIVSLGVTILLTIVVGIVSQSISIWLHGGPGIKDPDSPASNIIERRVQTILQKRADAAAQEAAQQQQNDKAGRRRSKHQKQGESSVVVKAPRVRCPRLTHYELRVAEQLVDPDDIENDFAHIGGLDKIKEELYSLAILPLLEPRLFAGSALGRPCKGILLYGAPGTGKTLMAKALAKEAAAVFLPLPLSAILNKWAGESNKLVAAAFSLATKLAPSIIFIDELDTFLRANNKEDAYLDTVKSEFLQLWDGINTKESSQVMVLGATNRPHGIDRAILRRMPRQYEVPLPDRAGRLAILQIFLKDEQVAPDVRKYLPTLANRTEGYSGSDLKELCKTAALKRIHERTREFSQARTRGHRTSLLQETLAKPMRPISAADLKLALEKVKKTGQAAQEFGHAAALDSFRERAPAGQPQLNLHSLLELLTQVSDLSVRDDRLRRDNETAGTEDEDSVPEMTPGA